MMRTVQIVLFLLCLKYVFALKKEFCKPTDNKCLTKAVKEHVYQRVIKGLPGVAPSDPLCLDKIVVDLPHLKYTLDHPTLLGLKNCDFQLRLTPETSSLVYEYLCPHLIIKSDYEVKGEIDKVTTEGSGNCEIRYDNYLINVTGQYERIKREDGKLHFHIIDYCVHLDNDAQATPQYYNLSICGGGDVDQYAKRLEERTRHIVMNTILDKGGGHLACILGPTLRGKNASDIYDANEELTSKSLKKEFCNPKDNDCLTQAVREHVYQMVMKGLPGVAPSDPLHLDKVEVDLPNLKYRLDHPTLLGMKTCDFQKLRLTPESASVVYELLCPHLIIKSDYEVIGEIDEVTAEGKGNCEITYDNYFLNISGKYERITREDGKLHFHLIEVFHLVDKEAQATTHYQNLSISGKEDADQYTKKLEEKTRHIVMKTILDRFINNLQDFQRIMPIEELHFRYV